MYGPAITDEIVLNPAFQYTVTDPSTDENLNFDGDLDVGGGGPIVIRSSEPGIRRTVAMADIGASDRMIHLVNVSGVPDLTLRDLDLAPTNEVPGQDGGAILGNVNGNDLKLENVEIVTPADPTDPQAVDGGLIYVDGADSTFSMSDSTLIGGDATNQGGGLYVDTGQPATVERSLISLNTVTAADPADAQGGGIFANGPINITSSEISDNLAEEVGPTDNSARGGGLMAFGTLTMNGTLVADNRVFNSNLGVEEGGGIRIRANSGPFSLIQNSTIFGNEAGDDPGDNSLGGGLFNVSTQVVNVVQTTFSLNNATNPMNGDQIHNVGSVLVYASSVIPGGGGTNVCFSNDSASLVSGGFNALSPDDPNGCDDTGPGDATGLTGIVGGDPVDNGGPAIGGSDPVPTRTIAISGGNAQDLVPTANCGGEGFDARGVARPQGAACDAGAYERCLTPGGSIGVECPAIPVVPAAPATPTAQDPCPPLRKKLRKAKRKDQDKKVKKLRRKLRQRGC
jgi:hypothetical protein